MPPSNVTCGKAAKQTDRTTVIQHLAPGLHRPGGETLLALGTVTSEVEA
jgi:hypothetical protein